MTKLFDKNSEDFLNAIKGVVESTAAFEKARDEEKKKRMSGEDRDKVAKLAAMMSKEKMKKEDVSLDEKLSDEAKDVIRKTVKATGAKVKPLVSLAKMGKKEVKEDAEQIDELSSAKLGKYISATREKGKAEQKKRAKGVATAVDKMSYPKGSPLAKRVPATEEVEQIAELSKKTLGSYVNKAAERIGTQGVTAGLKIAADEKSKKNFDNMGKRQKGIAKAVDRLTKEEIEMIEAKMAGVAAGSMEGDKHMCATKVFHKEWNEGTPIKTMHADPDADGLIEWYDVMFDHGIERVMTEDMEILQQESHMHSRRGMKKEDVDQIDELSRATIGRYAMKAKSIADNEGGKDRTKGRELAGRKRWGGTMSGVEKAKVMATEEAEDLDESVAKAADHLIKRYGDNVRKSHVRSAANDLGVGFVALSHHVRKKLGVNRLEEARGRPKKAAAKDFTVHPITKEKLMHNNPEHMKKIEKLQKHGVLEKPKTEAGQHIINQLRKASTSMQGGATVHFTHGESKHVSAAHAGKALDKYAGMKPAEKEDFQKKISHSHENLMKHI